MEIILDKEDVTVEKILIELCECQEGPITHFVQIDLRAAGQCSGFGEYCEPCANEFANRIRSSLPEPQKEAPQKRALPTSPPSNPDWPKGNK